MQHGKDYRRLLLEANARFQTTSNRSIRRRRKMATLKTEVLLREFYFNGVRIPDPGPEMTVEQVRELL